MKIEYIREFCMLAEMKNFTAVANTLFITQPALSRHLVTIEEEFGRKLIVRSPHKVELTEAGHLVLHEFRRILAQYDGIETKLTGIKGECQGSLHIGMLYYAVKEYAYPAMSEMRRKHPKVELSLHSYQPHALNRDLLNQKLDLGFVMNFPFESDHLLRFHKVGRQRFIVMLPAEKVCKDEISISEMMDRPLVFSQADPEMNNFIYSLLRPYNFSPKNIVDTNHVDTMIFSVLECGGAAIVPWCLRNIQNEMVKYVEIREEEFEFDVSWGYRFGNNNPAISAFIHSLA